VRALDAKRYKNDGMAEHPAPYDSGSGSPPSEDSIRADAVTQLRVTIAGMNLEDFVVRQRRRTVEKYLKFDAWISIDNEARDELVSEVAPLPTAKRRGTEEAKRFRLADVLARARVAEGLETVRGAADATLGDRLRARGADRDPRR
jgi:type I restriction enzyme R subunit